MNPHRTWATALCRLALPALVLGLVAWAAPAARADAIDLGLIKKAPEIIKYLKDHDYKNVGVLRFQLQKGKGKPSYSAGPINGNMATRLENALLMEIDPKAPIGIIRDASAVASDKAKSKHWNEDSAKDRASLFEHTYPLAWGDDKVKADAFLLGRVKLSEDMRTTTVHVACFDKKTETEHMVCSVEVKTDRTVLADAGQSYVLARGRVKKREAEIDNKSGKNKDGKSLDDLLNDDAANSAKDRDKDKNSGLSNDYVDFQIWYDDDQQQVSGDPSDGGELRINPPRPGQRVYFSYRNKTQDDIGLVVFVNGTSTLEKMQDTAENCRRWILPADGKTYWIKGYVDADDNLTPFKIVGAGDDLVKNELAEKLGQIEVFVFLKGTEPTNNEMLVSRNLNLRKRSAYYAKKIGADKKPGSAAEARKLAFRSTGLKVPLKSRAVGDGEAGYIVPDPELTEKLTIEQRSFPNPTLVATPIVIRYNDKPSGNGGSNGNGNGSGN
jgi:hypothetical protein